MQNTGANGSGSIRPEDVISKLKDDGDFDRLRVKIIRKLKDNHELRSNIISLVKQSATLNCSGAENLKPRQLSDAIHQEIGDKLMSQVSDGVWNIIRSADGMKTEIRETIQSVYDKLSYPNGKDNDESSSTMISHPIPYEIENNGDAAGAKEIDSMPLDGELNAPPGFALTNPHKKSKNNHMNKPNKLAMPPHNGKPMERNGKENINSENFREPDNLNSDAPPGFFHVLKYKKSGSPSDEEPDVPPGFG